MKKWYSVELCPELAQLLKVWLRAKCVSYETSEVCQNFLDEL